MGNELEGLRSKVFRHVREGDLSQATIIRGISYVVDEIVLSSGIEKAGMERVCFLPNYLGLEDLNFAEYFFVVTKPPETAVAVYSPQKFITLGIRACMYEFPLDSRLELVVSTKDEHIK